MLTFAADNLTERGKRLHGTPPAPLADTRRTGHEKAGEHPFFFLTGPPPRLTGSLRKRLPERLRAVSVIKDKR